MKFWAILIFLSLTSGCSIGGYDLVVGLGVVKSPPPENSEKVISKYEYSMSGILLSNGGYNPIFVLGYSDGKQIIIPQGRSFFYYDGKTMIVTEEQAAKFLGNLKTKEINNEQ